MARPIRLGSFDLVEPVGSGGMGQVWRGEHREQQVPVAIKLLRHRPDEELADAFRREVRAVAGLDHPNVILVLDSGEVTAEAASASGGILPEGAPWLAMEYAVGGSLATKRGRLDWRGLKGVLLTLLDALAHAHARGVVHRDLKPANVLLGGLRPGLKLTDFGIAQLHRQGAREQDASVAGGTPAYVAPEQIEGQWRDYGPWTDLYGLGALAWSLVTGAPPFRASGWSGYAKAHLTEPLPALRARHPVPAGLEGWLHQLLAKDPVDRFRRAADAAFALEQLDPPPALDPAPVRLPDPPDHDAETVVRNDIDPEAPTSPPQVAPRMTLHWSGAFPTFPPDPGGPPLRGRRRPAPRPPLASTWARPRPPPPPVRLLNAGLGLFGLRRVPVVGRTSERDQLWRSLHEATSGRPRAVRLHGPAGCGKSRLAEWLCERGHELGAAEILTAVHAAVPGPGDGVGPMLARWLGCAGLHRAQVEARLARILPRLGFDDPEDLASITELVAPATAAERAAGLRAPRLTDAERQILATRVVRSAAVERPVVVWIDDAQWGAGAVELALELLDSDIGVLCVLTVQDEARADHPEAARALQRIEGHPGCSEILVELLDGEETATLLRELLGLDADLAHDLRRRVGGNPMFAVQLMGDWVQRGLLIPAESGFQLRRGAEPPLPDDVHGVWLARVARLCDAVGGGRRALALAACLGMEVDEGEWRRAVQIAGLEVPDGLVARLLDQRLVRPLEGVAGFAFVHGMLRESLLRTASRAGWSGELERACAQMLAERSGDPGRLGRHRLAAGEGKAAIEPLARAAAEARTVADLREAVALLELQLQAMSDAQVRRSAPAWGETWATLAEVCRSRGALSQAASWAQRVMDEPERPGWRPARVRAAFVLAFLALKDNRTDEAIEDLRRVIAALDAIGLVAMAIRARVTLCIGLQFVGQIDEADRVVSEATGRATELGDDPALGEAHRMRGAISLQLGRLDEAGVHYEEARRIFDGLGNRGGRSLAEVGLGDVARFDSRLQEAEAWYVKAIGGLEACGAASAWSVRISLALVWQEQERWAEALDVLERGVLELQRRGSHLETMGLFRFMALPSHAALGQWDRFDEVLSVPPIVDADVARACTRAADLADQAGQADRAARVRVLAEEQWKALGR